MAKVNILVSWVWSSSSAPMPSVSITMILMDYPFWDLPLIGVPQHQSPLVQGLIVGPTPKPCLGLLVLMSILLSKYDFPVLYSPATDTTPRGAGTDLRNLIDSYVSSYSRNEEIITSCLIINSDQRNRSFCVIWIEHLNLNLYTN